MAKFSSGDSSDDDHDDAKETTNISPTVENYCKLTFKWSSLLLAKISAIASRLDKYAELLKELEDILEALDDEGDVMKSLNTIDVKLKKADVEKKLKKSSVTTPPNPSKKRKTADFQLPKSNSIGVLDIWENINEYVTLFEAEALRLNLKIEFGSADVSRVYQLESEADVSKQLLLEAREKLKNIIKKMKEKRISSVAST